MTKTILVTGGSGLLGRYLADSLSAGNNVILLTSNEKYKHPVAETICFDLRVDNPKRKLPSCFDSVVFAAQSNLYRSFPEGAQDVFDVNVASPVRLISYALECGARDFVYCSSGSVYDPLSTEIVSPIDCNMYQASKIAAEYLLNPFKTKINLSLLRIFFMYGVGQRQTMLITRLIRDIEAGNPISLDEEKGLTFSPLYAGDVSGLIKNILSCESAFVGDIFGPEKITLRALCEKIGFLANKKPVFSYTGKMAADFSTLMFDRKVGQIHIAQTKIDDGIKKVFNHR